MQVAAAPAIDAPAVLAAVRRRLDPDPELAPLLDAYLAKLPPERWAIEWHLPLWLATRLALADHVAAALVESNVLGLLAVRLTDDVVDGDIDPEHVPPARALAAAALDAALGPYRELFPPASSFWPFLDRCMAAWRAGSDSADLAVRAAPIKVVANACCRLAGRNDLWPALERCLELAMRALVLYDQFFDWEADVEAGRWNAFAAMVLGDDRATGAPQRARAAILTAMLTREVVADHFLRVGVEAGAAARIGDELGLDELSSYLRSWAAAALAQGDAVAEHYRGVAARATRLLFPNAVGTHIGGGQA